MARLPQSRVGQRLLVRGRQVGFSFFPSRPSRAHHALQSLLFALDPWSVIRRSVEDNCPANRRTEALATLRQAQDFYTAGTERGIESARPVALYYSYMNLVKTFCLTRGLAATFNQAQHGLSEQLSPNGREFFDAYLSAYASPNQAGKLQNFDEMKAVLTGAHLAATARYDLPSLLPQVLSGHRLWAQASGKKERFIALHEVQFMHNQNTNDIWIRFYLFADDLTRLGITHTRFAVEAQLTGVFREVQAEDLVDGRRLLCFEQLQITNCPNGYPADYLPALVSSVKSLFWSTVSTIPSYRRYYVYLSPQVEINSRCLSCYQCML